jgi:predicted RNA binding protein YcfA (HicA-like mRNA interferase family)
MPWRGKKLPSLSSQDIIDVIKLDGWRFKRIKGDHHHFRHPIKRGLVTVPHPVKNIDKDVFFSILRQAGLTKKEFIRLYFEGREKKKEK